MLDVNSRPDPLSIDPARTAVLVIDMQNDFGSPGGMFDRAGIDITGIQAAAAATKRFLQAARAAGLPVVYVTMEHPADLANAGPEDGPHRRKHAPLGLGDGRTLVSGAWGTQIVDELEPHPGDAIVSKHRYSGFFETELDDVLRGLGATALVVTGCTTSICVESTVRDAMFRDYTCLVLEDCTAEPLGADGARTNHDASLLNIEALFGWVTTSTALAEALAGAPSAAVT
jgi:ureidoacrylate peracid hydrolase